MKELTEKQKEKLKQALEEGKVTDTTTLGVFQMVTEMQDEVDSFKEEITSTLEETVKQVKDSEVNLDKVLESVKGAQGEQGIQGEKGEKGDKGDMGERGPQGLKGLDSVIPGPKGDKGESGKDGKNGKDGLPGKDGQDGSPDTPEQVISKVNEAKTLIKKERVQGLADIERIAIANANFNPAMGPSFSDLENIKKTVVQNATINFVIDGGGSAITTGVKGFVEMPYNFKVTGWQVFADQIGSVVVDVWRSTYASFPPVVGGTITGSELPTLVSQQNNQNLSLTTWNNLLAGDIIGYNINSASTVTRLTVAIIGIKS